MKTIKNSVNTKSSKQKLTAHKKNVPNTVVQNDKLKKLPIKRSNTNKLRKLNNSKKGTSMFDASKEEEANFIEKPIKLTEFVPMKIKLKRDFDKKQIQVVNQTLSASSPCGSMASNIRICSLISESNSFKSKEN